MVCLKCRDCHTFVCQVVGYSLFEIKMCLVGTWHIWMGANQQPKFTHSSTVWAYPSTQKLYPPLEEYYLMSVFWNLYIWKQWANSVFLKAGPLREKSISGINVTLSSIKLNELPTPPPPSPPSVGLQVKCRHVLLVGSCCRLASLETVAGLTVYNHRCRCRRLCTCLLACCVIQAHRQSKFGTLSQHKKAKTRNINQR